ncbi:MAG: TIGR02757 family protein [Bacteroidaceae bacterium]|nr:TIGR02757 family protein [Bacteroidaceae bacterium]
MEKVKRLLDNMVLQYNCKEFIVSDPVQFPHAFSEKKDVEIAALLASVIAWGNRTMILRSGKKMFYDIMGGEPYEFIMRSKFQALDESINIHRTFFVRDFLYICRGLQYVYSSYDSLETLFECGDTWKGIERLRTELANANEGISTRHISNPVAVSGKPASACKRLHMMLRWLCRDDGIVDIGLWKAVSPASLMMPLDVHVARTSRELGLVSRKQNDRKTVEELTSRLREFSPDDPVKYDFALFGVGVSGADYNND